MGRTHVVAVPPGTDPATLTRHLHRAHDEFVSSGRADPSLRPLFRDSWQRSLAGGMDPERSRLRTVIGPLELASRPYRLRSALQTDVAVVRDYVAVGHLRRAVATYRGPVLPASSAPAVGQLRDRLHMCVRSALLAGDDADALLSFADTHHGRDDLAIWERALHVLPVSSPRYAQVAAHVERLEPELS